MNASVRPLLFAWQFLTAVPVSRDQHDPAPLELARSMSWYPLVGLLLGGVLAGSGWLLTGWLPYSLVAALLVVFLVAITGGLHQDGLADTLDGMAGGRTPAERLAIMRDPRIGSIGATGLALSLLLRYAALASLPEPLRWPGVLCMPAIGRWAMVTGAYGAQYARAEPGLAGPFLANLSVLHVAGATVVVGCLLVSVFGSVPALSLMAMGAVVSRAITRLFQYSLGGVTGDTLGATNELVEVSFLIVLPLLIH